MPSLDRRLAVLHRFLRMFTEPEVVFFLGAGTSHPIVPMAAKLGKLVLEQTLALGHYSAGPIPLDRVAERIVGQAKQKLRLPDRYKGDWMLRVDLGQRIAVGAVQAAAISLLHPGIPGRCPQYEVFQWLAHPATILNFNNDGLADAFCTKHLILNGHGTSLHPELRQALDRNRLIDRLQMFPEERAPTVPGLLLPQREPCSIIATPPYLAARSPIPRAEHIALIGYSFGGMDDHVAYRLLTQAVAHTRVPVIVVGPEVDDLVMRLRDDVNGATVLGLAAYWNVLAGHGPDEILALAVSNPTRYAYLPDKRRFSDLPVSVACLQYKLWISRTNKPVSSTVRAPTWS